MFKALKRWLGRRPAESALPHTDLIARSPSDGLGPVARMHLNRADRYEPHEAIQGWHRSAYVRDPAPSLKSLERQERIVRKMARRQGWL